MKKINNAIARIWTKSDLKQTIKQAQEGGYLVNQEEDFTEITNPQTGEVVLRSLYTGGQEIVRLDSTYFE
jgi:hypothetical protein